MQEEARCQLCDIPDHYSHATRPAPVVAATPSTARRHQRHAPHQAVPVVAATPSTARRQQQHAPHQCHSNHISHSSSQEATSGSEHKQSLSNVYDNLGQFSSLDYRYNQRHTITEDPTFIQELSSYIRSNRQSYHEEPSRRLNNKRINYPQTPNILLEDHHRRYSQDHNSKIISNLPGVPQHSGSNSYNKQILNPRTLHGTSSSLRDNSRGDTLPTNMSTERTGSQLSMLKDVDQDYFLNLQKSRFRVNDAEKREAKKQMKNVQLIMLIGCFALMFVVGIIMFVAVCYQNGWLGLGRGQSTINNFSRRQNEELHRIHKPINNFPDGIHRQRSTAPGRGHLEYPNIGLSARRPHPSEYGDRIYQQLPRFSRHVDDRTSTVNDPINEMPKPERLVDNRQSSTFISRLVNDTHNQENLKTMQKFLKNELMLTYNNAVQEEIIDTNYPDIYDKPERLEDYFHSSTIINRFVNDSQHQENSNFDGMGKTSNSQDDTVQEKLIDTNISAINDKPERLSGNLHSPTNIDRSVNDTQPQENLKTLQMSLKNEGTVTHNEMITLIQKKVLSSLIQKVMLSIKD